MTNSRLQGTAVENSCTGAKGLCGECGGGAAAFFSNLEHSVNQWINPAAFHDAPEATTIGQTDYSPLGGSPTQFYGPGFHRFDFSLFKEFRTTEKTQLEFRAEFFNLTNHPNFSPPGFGGNGVVAAPGSLNYDSPLTFGVINSTRDGQNDQREIQFALKLYF